MRALCRRLPPGAGQRVRHGAQGAKAIYRPFPQSEPAAYIIDREACLNDKILVCQRCVEVCEPDAIDFDMLPEDLELDLYLARELHPIQQKEQAKYGDAFILAEAWSDAMAAVQPKRISEPPEVARGNVLD